MKNTKNNKGITLVALIITIVVLLILAAVAIGTVRDSNIIGHAQNAAGAYNQAKANELDALAEYEQTLDKYAPRVLMTEKEKTEILALIMQYVICMENEDAEGAATAKQTLIDGHGTNLDEIIEVFENFGNSGYVHTYFHEKQFLLKWDENEQQPYIYELTNEEIKIADKLYEIAETIDKKLEEEGTSIIIGVNFNIQYGEESIIVSRNAGTWQFNYNGSVVSSNHKLENGETFRGI